jgi:hypothetical protein
VKLNLLQLTEQIIDRLRDEYVIAKHRGDFTRMAQITATAQHHKITLEMIKKIKANKPIEEYVAEVEEIFTLDN